MKCPACEHEVTRVFDVRGSDTARVKRRRRCVAEGCGHVFTTYEFAAPGRPTFKPADVDKLVDAVAVDVRTAVAGHVRASVRRALRGLKMFSDPEDQSPTEEVRA